MLALSFILSMIGSVPTMQDIAQSLAVFGSGPGADTRGDHYLGATPAQQHPIPPGHILADGLHSADGFIAARVRSDLVGKDGLAVTDLRPSGTVAIDDERIDVVTEGDYIKAGSTVRFIRAEGYRHVVRASAPGER